jgi:uncharacterized repeat protein (TIGR01451 family)
MIRLLNLFKRSRKTTPSRKATQPRTKWARPCLQVLEDRTLLSGGSLLSGLLQPGVVVLQDNSASAVYDSTGAVLSSTSPIAVGDIVTGVLRITQSNAGSATTLDSNQQLSILFSGQVTNAVSSGWASGTTLYTLGATPSSSGKSIDQLLSGSGSQFATGTFSSNTIFAMLESQPNSTNVTSTTLASDLAAFKSASTYSLDLTGGLVASTDFFEATLRNLGSATGPTPNNLLGTGTAGFLDGITNLGSDSGAFSVILDPAGVSFVPGGVTATHEDGITTVAADLSFTASLTREDPTAFANGYAIRDNTFISVNIGTPDLLITKTADQAAVNAGQPIGFVVTITNTGTTNATGVSLSDPLPGLGDLNWSIASQSDSTNSGNTFLITGSPGSQSLSLTNNGSVTLQAGEVLTVHITSPTTTLDTTGTSISTAPNWLGAAGDYSILYTGTGGDNLNITNSTDHGNVGVGGTGVVQFGSSSQPGGTLGGRLDFAANTAQFNNNNGANVGPNSVKSGVGAVTTALNTINSLSSSLAGLGNSIAISGTQTINESDGQLDPIGGVMYRVFKVTSYSESNGNLVTINGDGSGDPVVFNFGFASSVALGGNVTLTGGLTDDQVLWNFTTSGQTVSLNTNASGSSGLAFHGDIIAMNDTISLTNANLNGRVFGGNSSDMQIGSGSTIKAPLLNTATVTATNVPPDSDDKATATVSITATSPIGSGQTATLGFWKNAGQNVILNFNGSANSTALGNWMATNFGNLFGNFAGKTNTFIANAFKTGGASNTYQQAFAIALDIYATTTSLGGASVISGGFTTKYGFKVTDAGAGNMTWDVGSAAAAFDIPPGGSTVLTLYQILKKANSHYSPSTGQFYVGSPNQSSYTDKLNTTLNNINERNDIK